MRKYLLSFLFFLLIFSSLQAQEDFNEKDIKVVPELINPSNLINDGIIELNVTGGVPPYTFKWSDQDTSLKSNKATGVVEGIDYTVVITDAEQNTLTKSYRIPAESITENFNGAFKPIVDNLASILFWDPFSAIGLYDPIVYADEKNVPIPNWYSGIQDAYKLEEWLVKEGEHVDRNQSIAIIKSEKEGNIEVKASASGTLTHLTSEGNTIYDYQNTEDVIEAGAHFFAKVKYDEPVILTHPNGDPITFPIPFIVVWLILGAAFFTLRMGFINLRGFRHALDLAKGKYDDPNAPGRITHFQALATAVSATVGLGNIAGVAVAISLGGAGATFWMILAGLLGMSSKFVECTLGVKYRFISKEGKIFGGPMNYLRYGLEKRNMSGLGKFLAGFFAVLGVGASFG